MKREAGLAEGWLIAPTGGHWLRWRAFHVCRRGGLPISSPLVSSPEQPGYQCRQCGAWLAVDSEGHPAGEVVEMPASLGVELQRLTSRILKLLQQWERATDGT